MDDALRAAPARGGASEAPDQRAVFVEAMSLLASGLAVITARSADGDPCGLLVNSLRSYSVRPPSVLVCVDCALRSHDAVVTCGEFGVHLLRHDQASVASAFAAPGPGKFASVPWCW